MHQRSLYKIDRIKRISSEKQLTTDDIIFALYSNQDGDAALYVVLNRNRFVYDHSARKWYVFGEHHWCEDTTGQSLDAIKAVIKIYTREAWKFFNLSIEQEEAEDSKSAKDYKKNSDDYHKRIRALQTLYRKKAVLKLAALGDYGLGIRGDEWDQKPMLFPCANGVVDLETGKRIDGKPDHYLRTASPISYHPDAPEPKTFLQFINDVFSNNRPVIEYIQRLFGSCLIGRVREHIFPILWGKGRNGKGTLLQIISHVLGPMAGPVKASLLLDHGKTRSSAAPNPDILDLRGKRLVWASETNEGAKFNSGQVKWLVGGDILVGRAMYGKYEIRFEPAHTLFLITNHKPSAPAGYDDFAFWQRVHLIPFNISFVESPQGANERIDKDLPEKLKSEAVGILTWLIRGCLEYQRIGLKPPDDIKIATKKYEDDEDVISRFIAECCIRDPESRIKGKELYDAYENWSKDSGYKQLSQVRFGKDMGNRFNKIISDGVKYLGLRLNRD